MWVNMIGDNFVYCPNETIIIFSIRPHKNGSAYAKYTYSSHIHAILACETVRFIV